MTATDEMRIVASKLLTQALAFAILAIPMMGQTAGSEMSNQWVIEVESDQKTVARSVPLGATGSDVLVPNLPRRPDWKMPRGGDPVQGVKLRTKLAGGRAVVTVSQLSGKRPTEKKIAELMLFEGEGRKVEDMADFGFESLIVKLVRVDPAAAKLPTIVNPSPTLSATVETEQSDPATLLVRLVNSSAKAIDGIIWRTENAGRARLLGVAENKNDETLIGANGSYDLVVRTKLTDDSGTRLILDAIIFTDGTVHGDASAADNFLRFKAGRREALAKILAAFDDGESASGSNPDVLGLINAIDQLNVGVPRLEGRPTTPEGFAFTRLVADAVEALNSIHRSALKNEQAERDFADLKSFYRSWYARLLK
jgi:hypothetical protein